MTLNQEQFFAQIPDSWKAHLQKICSAPEIDTLVEHLIKRQSAGAIIYPSKQNKFAALEATPFDNVKVVIIGQDPYHGPGQAHGLSFSVLPGIAIPPSLRNIYKELHDDIGMPIPKHGTLSGWARQGVLLLNAVLTVELSNPASHANKGWELFTDAIINQLLKRDQPLVLMLWGAYAQKKMQQVQTLINPAKHLILKSGHPSPLSVRFFLGCKHFSQANNFLKKNHVPEINWQQL